jgi:hypothetical protein
MNFTLKYFDVIPPQKCLYRSVRSDTSDETKQLEVRPNKRDASMNYNLDSHSSLKKDKKSRPTTGPHDDTLSAGLSTSN